LIVVVVHTKQPLLRVIRTNCVECCAGNEAEVRRCGMHWCPFWPYRMGSNPFAAPKSEAQLRAETTEGPLAGENMAKLTAGRKRHRR
jgi:hypothetical protein